MSVGATFWSFAAMGPYVCATPYTQNGVATGPYFWINQGQGNTFARPVSSPGTRVNGTVGQFIMTGDLYQTQQQALFTGNGSQTTYTGTLSVPMASTGTIYDSQGHVAGTFANGIVTGSGYLSSGTINYSTGAISLTFGTAPPSADVVYCQYTLEAPYRLWWPAIGNPTNWPTPLTNAAIAAQSGFEDLEVDLGRVMFISGYPLYGLAFQEFGVTRLSYIGGNVVFSFQTYERKRGCIAHGAAIQVGLVTYYLADDGWFGTDGANVFPIGTANDNSAGIDNWFWSNVNTSALEAIRSGYDAQKRCLFFSIPTGSNTLPDTLLTYNTISQRWTKAAIATECLWTADNGTDINPANRQILGVIDQSHTPNALSGTTLTGYVESTDVYFADANRRLVTGARPHINCVDSPLITIGSRQNLQQSVAYSTAQHPDPFSGIAPALQGGVYNRARVASGAAQALNGATLFVETEGNL